jgi:septin family protein
MTMLSFTQTVNLIKRVGHKRTIIVQGENGIGKTASFHYLCKDQFFANHISRRPD